MAGGLWRLKNGDAHLLRVRVELKSLMNLRSSFISKSASGSLDQQGSCKMTFKSFKAQRIVAKIQSLL